MGTEYHLFKMLYSHRYIFWLTVNLLWKRLLKSLINFRNAWVFSLSCKPLWDVFVWHCKSLWQAKDTLCFSFPYMEIIATGYVLRVREGECVWWMRNRRHKAKWKLAYVLAGEKECWMYITWAIAPKVVLSCVGGMRVNIIKYYIILLSMSFSFLFQVA